MADIDSMALCSEAELSDAETIESTTVSGYESDDSSPAHHSAAPQFAYLDFTQACIFSDQPHIGLALETLETPRVARTLDNIVDSNEQILRSRISHLSQLSLSRVGNDESSSAQFLDQVYQLQHVVLKHCQRADTVLLDAMHRRKTSPTALKELVVGHAELRRARASILRETAVIKRETCRLRDRMWRLPGFVTLGQAYRTAMGELQWQPSGAPFGAETGDMSETESEDSASAISEDLEDETSSAVRYLSPDDLCFNDRLTKHYSTPLRNLWCPISGPVKVREARMTPVQIVPAAIGEATAAYMFGEEPEDAYDTLWSVKNGIFLREDLARLFERGDFVIVPDPEAKDEFIVVVLCPILRAASQTSPSADGKSAQPLHQRRLQFQSAARPDARYLRMHAVMTIARRRRAGPVGWLDDTRHVFDGQNWGFPHPCWARASMVQKLVHELSGGEENELMDVIQGLGYLFRDQRSRIEEVRMATYADLDLAEYYEERRLNWIETSGLSVLLMTR